MELRQIERRTAAERRAFQAGEQGENVDRKAFSTLVCSSDILSSVFYRIEQHSELYGVFCCDIVDSAGEHTQLVAALVDGPCGDKQPVGVHDIAYRFTDATEVGVEPDGSQAGDFFGVGVQKSLIIQFGFVNRPVDVIRDKRRTLADLRHLIGVNARIESPSQQVMARERFLHRGGVPEGFEVQINPHLAAFGKQGGGFFKQYALVFGRGIAVNDDNGAVFPEGHINLDDIGAGLDRCADGPQRVMRCQHRSGVRGYCKAVGNHRPAVLKRCLCPG